MTGHFCVDIQQEGESNKAGRGLGLLHWLVSGIYNLSGMKEIHKMKVQHAQAAGILNLVCENLVYLNEVKKNMVGKAMTSVAKEENVEFLLRVTKANPELITLVSFGQPDLTIFFDAVEYRRAEIFNLLCGFRFKNVVATLVDLENSNTLLHVAAMLAPSSYLNRIPGATLQMQREIQWFKAVDSVVDAGTRLSVNTNMLNPLEYFKENHKELRAQGEKWMKEIASSSTIMIMLQYNLSRLWVTLPIIVLAGIPVTIFVLLQFPLLVEVTSSTYGSGIFKKVEKWP
ncbi:uncharacterized protein LOC114728521 [Neltuma alba]|uniref:uncharacterized protein LOC114728521 n=1 Tax=Neltuma alba TaxID=207710 RepID=UPI0010A42AB7|nr:uncharacterized protein LOC114728521 [Prosopis alba]